jgi:hypothetical protein
LLSLIFFDQFFESSDRSLYRRYNVASKDLRKVVEKTGEVVVDSPLAAGIYFARKEI